MRFPIPLSLSLYIEAAPSAIYGTSIIMTLLSKAYDEKNLNRLYLLFDTILLH